jgi:hypothetical protein
MRSLYWLTAITLIAAAITTVAIADYSRRHPGSFFWQESPPRTQVMERISTETSSVACQANPSVCCSATPVVVSLPDSAQPACPACDKQPVPVVSVNSPSIPTYEEPPEHKQLREQTMQRLTMMQETAPALVPPIPAASCPALPPAQRYTIVERKVSGEEKRTLVAPSPAVPSPSPVSDEFSFPGNKPSAPTSATAPPPLASDFAAVPTVSPAQSPAVLPEASDLPQGAEVLPGLRPATPVKPAQDELANPVQDCLQATTEAVTLMSLPVHLTALPAQPQTLAPSTPKHANCCPAESQSALIARGLDATECTHATKPCCKDGKTCDDVIVRTYSISDFPTDKGSSHDDLIRLITTMVAPDTWATRDSNIEYFAPGKCLVVRHRANVHEQIDDLVNQLRCAVQKQSGVNFSVRLNIPAPIVRHEKTDCVPVQFEMLPWAPIELPFRVPRVFTDEPPACFDDDFFGLAPMRPDGRLMPVPAYSTGVTDTSLQPAGFSPVPAPASRFFEEGPAGKSIDLKPPAYFPMTLPFAPLPLGSEKNDPNKK